jgi:hypothetical protein
MEWVARITTVSLEMVLPGLLGHWADRQFGTRFLSFIGFGMGILGGFFHLLTMTSRLNRGRSGQRGRDG